MFMLSYLQKYPPHVLCREYGNLLSGLSRELN